MRQLNAAVALSTQRKSSLQAHIVYARIIRDQVGHRVVAVVEHNQLLQFVILAQKIADRARHKGTAIVGGHNAADQIGGWGLGVGDWGMGIGGWGLGNIVANRRKSSFVVRRSSFVHLRPYGRAGGVKCAVGERQRRRRYTLPAARIEIQAALKRPAVGRHGAGTRTALRPVFGAGECRSGWPGAETGASSASERSGSAPRAPILRADKPACRRGHPRRTGGDARRRSQRQNSQRGRSKISAGDQAGDRGFAGSSGAICCSSRVCPYQSSSSHWAMMAPCACSQARLRLAPMLIPAGTRR